VAPTSTPSTSKHALSYHTTAYCGGGTRRLRRRIFAMDVGDGAAPFERALAMGSRRAGVDTAAGAATTTAPAAASIAAAPATGARETGISPSESLPNTAARSAAVLSRPGDCTTAGGTPRDATAASTAPAAPAAAADADAAVDAAAIAAAAGAVGVVADYPAFGFWSAAGPPPPRHRPAGTNGAKAGTSATNNTLCAQPAHPPKRPRKKSPTSA